jgi:spore germination protein
VTPSQVQEPGQTPVPPRARRRRRGRLAPPLVFIVVIGVVAIAGAFMLARAFEDDRPRGPYLIGAWTFGDAGSLERAVDAGALDEVSLDWLQSRADGSVAAPRFDAGFLALVREKDCRVVVTLTDYDETIHTFDPRISAEILATAQTRRAHAEAVAEWCRANDVDGLDVDWEALKATQRGRFTAFVAELARQLHDDGRFIAVDVYPKLREPGGWDGPRAQDWSALGEVVDQVRVMTYNYSGSWSGPGPLSPPAWMDAVLAFAESQIASRKVVMGIGFYGRDWRGSETTDLVWANVRQIRADYHPRMWRGPSVELTLDYKRDGAAHTAFFPDARAIDAKLTMMLTRHPHIRGVYCWMLGQEDPAAWKVLRKRLH